MISLKRICFPAGEDTPKSWKAKHSFTELRRRLRKMFAGRSESHWVPDLPGKVVRAQWFKRRRRRRKRQATHSFIYSFKNACWKSTVCCGCLHHQAQLRTFRKLGRIKKGWGHFHLLECVCSEEGRGCSLNFFPLSVQLIFRYFQRWRTND